jgi:hypothetical protein
VSLARVPLRIPGLSFSKSLLIDASQLAVVRGLVRERTQQLGSDTLIAQEVFKTRRCRSSYGVAVRVPYDESKHVGLPVTRDDNNNRRWVSNVVE